MASCSLLLHTCSINCQLDNNGFKRKKKTNQNLLKLKASADMTWTINCVTRYNNLKIHEEVLLPFRFWYCPDLQKVQQDWTLRSGSHYFTWLCPTSLSKLRLFGSQSCLLFPCIEKRRQIFNVIKVWIT